MRLSRTIRASSLCLHLRCGRHRQAAKAVAAAAAAAAAVGGRRLGADDDGASARCSYCGFKAYQYCRTCEEMGLGQMYACGLKTGRDCMRLHAEGEAVAHGSRMMGSPAEARRKKKLEERAAA
eukprot:4866587-Pleurochrysis_carterae.AAC.1